MDAIILAAGKGTRLRPYTNDIPKPLLPVQGRPILDWIIGALPPVDRLIVVVNYLAEQIESYLQSQTHVRNWTTVRQTEPRGTALAAVPAGILVHTVEKPDAFGIVFPNPDGTLKEIREKPEGLPAPQLANIGGYVFPKSVFDLTLTLSPRGEYEITEAVALLAAKAPFHVVRSNYWLPIGDIDQWCWSQLKDVTAVK
jgi:bifunctional UDP-N-acetylglucosamine pyrophosphorylase/glucosamine-1-phosphate N-acetyltransferase